MTTHWHERLAALAEQYGVPGATLGILRIGPDRDEVIQAAYGLLNKGTGVETTADSVFQLGSMSKVWTATVIMQLVDEGLLDLDAPVAHVLPELRLADPSAIEQVTMRHLLTHTSGIDGDVFTDTGRGDDCLKKYVAELAGVAQNHPVGVTLSYCTSGYALAGRVIEKLTGGTWDDAIRQRIVERLDLRHAVTLPEEAVLRRTAVGHVGPSGSPTPVWALPRSLGPAGLICSSVGDVLSFARAHLAGGLAADGTRLLSAESVDEMASRQVEIPGRTSLGDSWGLGWTRMSWDGRRLIGHDGATIGQAAYLRLLPEAGLAVALLTNGGDARNLYEGLFREIFAELAGVAMPASLTPPEQPAAVDIRQHAGTYERASLRMDVENRAEGPWLRLTTTGPLAAMLPEPTQEFALVPVTEDLFLFRESAVSQWTPVSFYRLTTGERYAHFGARANPMVG